jgi:hypothetical protein
VVSGIAKASNGIARAHESRQTNAAGYGDFLFIEDS